jgi:hypothetical protein
MGNMKKDSVIKQGDITDSAKDQAKLQPETIVMDMPEVKDIPGQENIRVPRIKEMEDTTISSSDEEGDGILDELNSEERDQALSDDDSTVSRTEKDLLRKSAGHLPTEETAAIDRMALDDRDNEGDLLNEKGLKDDRSGEDLDTPGAELDDEDEDIGEEDEENNIYSQRD